MKKTAELTDSAIRFIAESNPGDIAVYRIDNGKLISLFSSGGLAELSGMLPEEYESLIRSDAASIILKQDLPAVREKISAVLAGQDADFTYRILHRTEGHIWVHARGRLIGTRNGYPVILVSYSRTSAESAGQSRLLDKSSTILYVTDRKTYEILYANGAALRLWGHGDYTAEPCYRYVNGLKSPCPWCSVPLMKNGFYRSEGCYSPLQDKWFSVECHEIDWYGRNAVAVYAADITEQKRQQQVIEADRDNLDSILGNIPGGVAIFSEQDGAMQLHYTNSAFYELHRWNPEHRTAISGNPLDRLSAADRRIFLEEFSPVKNGEKTQGSATYQVRGENGDLHWISCCFRHAYRRGSVHYYYASFVDMDEQIAAEAAKKEARKMYEAAVEISRLVVWEYDIRNSRVIMAENEFTEYDYRKFGLPKVTEHVPQSLVPYIDDDSVPAFLEMYRQIETGAPAASCEIWYKLKPGTEPRCERISYTTVFDAEGKPVKAYGIGQNITSHKREEENYKQAIREVAQASGHSLGAFSLNLTKNRCGGGTSSRDLVLHPQQPGTADAYFLAFSESISDEAVHEKCLKLFNRENLIAAFMRGETQVSLEYPVTIRNGEVHWQSGILNMMRNPYTGDIEAVAHILDIDHRKRLGQIADRVLSDRLDFAGILYPASGMIEFYSVKEGITRIAGGTCCTYASIRSYLRSSFVSPEDLETFNQGTDPAYIQQTLRGERFCQFYYKRVQDGAETYRHLQYSWLDESRNAILVIQTDITDSHRQEQKRLAELKEALAAAEKANRAKSDFLSRMSHDIRTPLNGIIGMTYLANEQDNPPKTADCLAKIDLSSRFLLGLINDVLDMSKAESGTITLHPEPYRPEEFFDYLNSVIEPLCREKNIHFILDAEPLTEVLPLIDPLRMNQAFFNLLSNAVKFTPEGGTVTCRFRESLLKNGRISLESEISDTGIGMSRDFQEILFEPFTQEGRSDSSETRGTGLGLSIVKKLLDLMHCSITVDSEIGNGTSFRIRGEFACVPAAAVRVQGSAESGGSRAPSLYGRHVLLCEDHPLNQEIARALLEKEGMLVTIADDGDQGVRRFSDSAPGFYDLVLMDIRMPVSDGYEATRRIRALDRPDAAAVPIIAMTADAFADDVQKCLRAGMNGHIAKPFEPSTLFAAIAAALKK